MALVDRCMLLIFGTDMVTLKLYRSVQENLRDIFYQAMKMTQVAIPPAVEGARNIPAV